MPTDRHLDISIGLVLVLATLLVFGQAAGFNFVSLDDDTNVYNNAFVKGGLTLDGLKWAFTATRPDYWRPLTWLSHMLDVQLFGMHPGWHHLTNVFLHTLNVLLLYWVLRRMTGAVWRSAIVAALFAIHPLRAESVVWVTERKDVLGGLFWWLATWAYIEYARHRASWKRYGLVVVAFILGLMAKPTVLAFPFFLLLLDYWPLKRRTLREKLPLFALSAASMAFTFQAQQSLRTTEFVTHLSLPLRLANGLVAYAAYLRDMLWPARLAAIYPYDRNLPVGVAVAAALLLATVTVLVIWKAKRFPYLITGWLWYLGVLLPVSGFIQMGFQSRGDRFTYIPLIGVSVMIVWGLHDLMSGWRYQRTAAIALATLTLTALGLRATSQAATWRDSVTLYRHNLTVTPDNQWALVGLGAELMAAQELDEAAACFVQALHVDPNHAQARNNLGGILLLQGKPEDALPHLSEAIRLKPDLAHAHSNLALALAQTGQPDEGMAEFDKALQLGLPPDLAEMTRRDLDAILSRKGNGPVP